MELRGRNVIVTGGGSGFGLGIAAAFARRGANVWITGRRAEKLAEAARTIGARPLQADVTKSGDWDRVFAAVGTVDVLVNNAGAGIRIAPLAEQTDDEILAAVNVNLCGAILGCARAARRMTERRTGAIVNISSVCALHAWPGWSVYTAAKAGLSNFSHGLFTELRPFGVRVFCVTPSWGRTEFNTACGIRGASEDARLAEGCIAPEELGRLVAELVASPDHLAVPDVTIQPMIQAIEPM